jgi:hypothetical protein
LYSSVTSARTGVAKRRTAKTAAMIFIAHLLI